MNDEYLEGWKSTMDWIEGCRKYFDLAVESGIPAFVGKIRESTPLTGSPYVIRLPQFLDIAKRWPGRRELIESFRRCLEIAEFENVRVQIVLIGGSFTDIRNETPHDMDSLWVYSLDGLDDVAGRLASMQRQFKSMGIDMRFVPGDCDLPLLAKTISYFSVLYCGEKKSDKVERGLLLIDCQPKAVGTG